MLGIREFWCGSESGPADPYLLLTDPDPTPDRTYFFSDFKMLKKFLYISFFNLPEGTLSSVLKIKFFAKILC